MSFLSFQEVEETPAKKSRRGKEPAVVRSPSLNRGKLSSESKPRIMFTGLVDKQGEKVSHFLNAWEIVRSNGQWLSGLTFRDLCCDLTLVAHLTSLDWPLCSHGTFLHSAVNCKL